MPFAHPIAVVGARGHVGRHVRSVLESAGADVKCLDRGDDVASGVAGTRAVVHLAGTLQPREGNSYRKANVETVKRTITAAQTHGVERVVLLSYVGANPRSSNAYLQTKGEAEEIVLSAGVEAVILRSTFIFGPPSDPGPSMTPFMSAGGKPVSVIGSGRQQYQPVFVDDVARAAAGALDPGFTPGAYALAGPDIIAVDDLVAQLNNGPLKAGHIQGVIAKVAAAVTPSLTSAMVDVLSADSLPDLPLAWTVLGIAPRPIEVVWREGVSA